MGPYVLGDGTIIRFETDAVLGQTSMSMTNPHTGAVGAEVLSQDELRKVAAALLDAVDESRRVNGPARLDLSALLSEIRDH